MISAITPPATKNANALQMYIRPIRLWSTVISHWTTDPCCQPGRRVGSSARTATSASLGSGCGREIGSGRDVIDQRLQLLVRPLFRDDRHGSADRGGVATLREELRERLLVDQQRVPCDLRTVPAAAVEAVALRAHAV